jgi:tRNA acetyltransferase TAN1
MISVFYDVYKTKHIENLYFSLIYEVELSYSPVFFSQFYDELVQGKDSDVKLAELPNKPLNKKIKFSDSESSSSDDDEEEEEGKEDKEDKSKLDTCRDDIGSHKVATNQEPPPHTKDEVHHANQTEEKTNDIEGNGKNHENQPRETEEPPTKKQCLGTDALKCVINEKVEEKSIDIQLAKPEYV